MAQSVSTSSPLTVEVGKSKTYTAIFTPSSMGTTTVTNVEWECIKLGNIPGNQVEGSINGNGFPPFYTTPPTANTDGTYTSTVTVIFGDLNAPAQDVKVNCIFSTSNDIIGNLNFMDETDDIKLEGIGNSNVSGPGDVKKCCLNNLIYAIDGYNSISSTGFAFAWTLPTGWSLVSGQGTPSIVVTPNTSGGGNVSCKITRPDASAAYFRTFSKTITRSNQIIEKGNSFPQAKICYGDILNYSVKDLCGEDSYQWMVPSGWTILSGNGTNAISVSVGNNAIDGNISISAIFGNGCTSVQGSFQVDVLTEAPSVVMDDQVAGSYEQYHCDKWKYCFPSGGSYPTYMFAQDLSSVQQWRFRTFPPFRVNGLLDITVNDPYCFVSMVGLQAPNSGMVQIQGINCQGASPWYNVPFYKELEYWCSEASYPGWCQCCQPPCASCPPYQLSVSDPDLMNLQVEKDRKILENQESDWQPTPSSNNTIYPNPVNSELTISIKNNPPLELMIFDSSGKLILSNTSIGLGENRIDVSSTPVGMYQLILRHAEYDQFINLSIQR